MGAWIEVIGYEGVDGNMGGNSIALDITKAKGCLREPESSHSQSIFVWNSKTGLIAHSP
jgi:hypothetical protein